jgi:hypothetical protein
VAIARRRSRQHRGAVVEHQNKKMGRKAMLRFIVMAMTLETMPLASMNLNRDTTR